MKFAHFAHVWGKSGMTPGQRFEELWKELQVCDETGFDYGFCVEHHFRPDESWMSAPSLYTVAAAARTHRIRLGGMGHVVPLHNPLRLAEEIAMADQMTGGRVEIGLVPGITPNYFLPFGADFETRRAQTLEYVEFLRAAFTENKSFSFEGEYHRVSETTLSFNPVQMPHPPLWIETRDPPTLEFCAKNGINVGYFFLFPRDAAAPRYRKFLDHWRAAGWERTPNIGYSTVVYVDETDEKAMEVLEDAGRAYRGFLPATDDPDELIRFQHERAESFEERGEPGAAEVMRHLTDPEYQIENELIILGSPDTVAEKLKRHATEGLFNTFMGEFNFGDLSEKRLLRSIRLFGEEVIPQLRDFEPF